MTIKQLREWLFLNGKTNEWWVNIDGKTKEETFALESIESFCSEYPTSKILVLHISHLENLGEPPWIDVDSAPNRACLTPQNLTNNPEAAPPPPPPPPPQDNPRNREQITEEVPAIELPTHRRGEGPRRPVVTSSVGPYAPTYHGSSSQKKNVFRLLFSLKGRINRKQFLIGYGLNVVAAMLLLGFIFLNINLESAFFIITTSILFLGICWSAFTMIWRRLKDTNTSPIFFLLLTPAFFFLSVIPFLNIVTGLTVFGFLALVPTNERSETKYGPQYDIF